MSATVIADVAAELEVRRGETQRRLLYRDERLRVLGFTFDAGQELTEHSSALPVVIQVVRGRLALTLGADKVEAAAGSWVHVPSRLPHTVHAVEPTVMLLTMLPDPTASSD